MSQMEMVDLDSLISSTHPYRRFQAYLPDSTDALADVRQLKGADGYGVERLFRRLLVQFMEELSDRELSRYLEKIWPPNGCAGSPCRNPHPTTACSIVSVPASGRLASPSLRSSRRALPS